MLIHTTVVHGTTASIWKTNQHKVSDTDFSTKNILLFFSVFFNLSSAFIWNNDTAYQRAILCHLVCGTDIGVIDPSLGLPPLPLVAISKPLPGERPFNRPANCFHNECVCMHANEQVFACVCTCIPACVCGSLEPQHWRLCGIWFFCVCRFFIFQFSIGQRSIANNYPQTTEAYISDFP